MTSWLGNVRRGVWDEASYLANYHLRPRLPRLVCTVEAAQQRLLGRAPLRILEGRGTEGHQTLAASFREPRLGRLFERRFAGKDAVVREQRPFDHTKQTAGSDIEAHEVPAFERTAWARRGFFGLPLWVRQVVPLERGVDPFPPSRHIRHRIRMIQRCGYGYEVTRDRAAFSEFYDRMYSPTMLARHGADAFVRGRRYLERGLRHGALLVVTQGGRRVAGILNVFHAVDPLHVSTWAGGLLDGDLDLLAEDADSACIYFSIQWALEKVGCRRISLSVTRPFLDDGLLRYRKRWGARLEPESAWAWNVVVLRVNRWTPAVRATLCSNPFIVVGRDGLSGVACWGGVAGGLDDLHAPGLSSLTIVTEHDQEPPPTASPDFVVTLTVGHEVEQLQALAHALAE
ncbi:MAG: hypothetical protein HYY06_33615 [Deltaproteobacteria bacterium]|nr:hypothetical protein [Deltaproteobacteria bacterium]